MVLPHNATPYGPDVYSSGTNNRIPAGYQASQYGHPGVDNNYYQWHTDHSPDISLSVNAFAVERHIRRMRARANWQRIISAQIFRNRRARHNIEFVRQRVLHDIHRRRANTHYLNQFYARNVRRRYR